MRPLRPNVVDERSAATILGCERPAARGMSNPRPSRFADQAHVAPAQRVSSTPAIGSGDPSRTSALYPMVNGNWENWP
jgi:hypothetical protein